MNVQPTTTRPDEPARAGVVQGVVQGVAQGVAQGVVQGVGPSASPAIFDASDVGDERRDDGSGRVPGDVGFQGSGRSEGSSGKTEKATALPRGDSPLLRELLARAGRRRDPMSSIPMARERSRSPQPGTSTGGETHLTGGRPGPAGAATKAAMNAEIIRQLRAGEPVYQIAENLHLSDDEVLRAQGSYLARPITAIDTQIHTGFGHFPSVPSVAPTVQPDVRQEAIRQLRGDVDRADIASGLHLTEVQVAAIHGQLIDDEFANINMDEFREITREATGHSSE